MLSDKLTRIYKMLEGIFLSTELIICRHHKFYIITITAYCLGLPYVELLFKKHLCGHIKVEATDIRKYAFLESSPVTPDSVKKVIMLYCKHVLTQVASKGDCVL